MLLLRFDKHVVLNSAAIADFLNCLALNFAVFLRVFYHLLYVLERFDSLLLDQLASRSNQLRFQLSTHDFVSALDNHHHPVEVLLIELSVYNIQFAFEALKSERIDLVAQPFNDDLFSFLGCHSGVYKEAVFEHFFLIKSLLLVFLGLLDVCNTFLGG